MRFALAPATFASLRCPKAGKSHQRHRTSESRTENKQIKLESCYVQPGTERSPGWTVLGRSLQKTDTASGEGFRRSGPLQCLERRG